MLGSLSTGVCVAVYYTCDVNTDTLVLEQESIYKELCYKARIAGEYLKWHLEIPSGFITLSLRRTISVALWPSDLMFFINEEWWTIYREIKGTLCCSEGTYGPVENKDKSDVLCNKICHMWSMACLDKGFKIVIVNLCFILLYNSYSYILDFFI